MSDKKWQLSPSLPQKIKTADSDLSLIVRQLLYNRGFKTIEEMDGFLNNQLTGADFDPIGDWFLSYDPFLFKDMKKVVDLIIENIKAAKKIIIYGDYDVDGVTASVVLLDTLKILGAKVDIYLPDRVSEGYGLNNQAIDKIKEDKGDLIVTVDTGIRNYQEVNYAKSLGLSIIITDHHILPDNKKEIPDCLTIGSADPNSGYPFSLLAGVGVAFKLASALIFKAKLTKEQKKTILEKNLDLVALGTIADLVPLIGENRLLTTKGLEILNKQRRLGLNSLIKIISRQDKPLTAWNVGWQLAPRLNAASRIGHANSAFTLLTTRDEDEAKELAEELNRRNIARQEITEKIMAQVEADIDPNNLPNIIIGLAQEDQFWNEGVIGLVAGKICEKYYRPTLIVSRIVEEAEFDQAEDSIKPLKTIFKGSGRSIEGFNLIVAIEKATKVLDKYGGHPMACGFSLIDEPSYQKFVEIIEQEANKIDSLILVPKLKLDVQVSLADINLDLVEEINKLAPFGQNNSQPKLTCQKARLEDVSLVGSNNQHAKLRFAQKNPASGQVDSLAAIFFNGAKITETMSIGQEFDLAFYVDINEFNGRREVQLKIIDIKQAN